MTMLLLGVVYPLVITGIAYLAFRGQANGSIVLAHGRAVGSDIIGQRWTQPKYFHGRPSAAGKDGYDPTATGGTNLAPGAKKFIDGVRDAIAVQKRLNPAANMPVPMDLVTASASGIDPDISPQAAYFQAARVARARGLSPAFVAALIARSVRPPELAFLGEPHVNVLELNLALDDASAASHAK